MTREEKVKMLTDVFKGSKPLRDVLPRLPITLIEAEPGYYTVTEKNKLVPVGKVDNYLEQLKNEYPRHVIDTVFINHDEYQELSARFEKEY